MASKRLPNGVLNIVNISLYTTQLFLRYYPCVFGECGKEFNSAYHLRQHSYTHMPESKRPFCTYCHTRFINETVLKAHIKQLHNAGKTDSSTET